MIPFFATDVLNHGQLIAATTMAKITNDSGRGRDLTDPPIHSLATTTERATPISLCPNVRVTYVDTKAIFRPAALTRAQAVDIHEVHTSSRL